MAKTDNWTIIVQRQQPHGFEVAEAERLFHAGLSIPEVSASLGIAIPTLRRAFLRHHGVTPRRWVVARRLETEVMARVREAEPLIASGKIPLGKVAEIVGFGSHQAMGLAFKQVHGLSPTHWRRAHGSADE